MGKAEAWRGAPRSAPLVEGRDDTPGRSGTLAKNLRYRLWKWGDLRDHRYPRAVGEDRARGIIAPARRIAQMILVGSIE
jgi:hypothetical protein